MTNTGHRYLSAIRYSTDDAEPWAIIAQGPFRSKVFSIKTHGYAEALRLARAYRDAQHVGEPAPRRWHRPDFNDLGARAGKVERKVSERRDEHRQFATLLKDCGLLGEHDDVKLANVSPRDLFGTAACMDLDARENGHERGRIIVPAPIDPTMADYARATFGVEVVEVWV